MTGPVPSYDVFAFVHGNDDLDRHRRGIPLWRLEDVVRHFTSRGFTGILIEQTGATSTAAPSGPDSFSR